MPMPHRTIFQATCFAGLLTHTQDGWLWCDGEPEPRLHAVPSHLADLRSRDDRPDRAVETPCALTEIYDPLRWALLAARAGQLDVDVSSGAYPSLGRRLGSSAQAPAHLRRHAGPATGMMVVLVPLDDWHAWCRACPVLPVWTIEDECSLREHAQVLGWLGRDDERHASTRDLGA